MNRTFTAETVSQGSGSMAARYTHTELNHTLLKLREKAELSGIRTELRIADLGLLPLRDDALCDILSAVIQDAENVAYNSERKRLYTAVITRTGQLVISVKASSAAADAALLASPNRSEIAAIRKQAEALGGSFVCSCDNGMICYTFCIGLS